MPFTTGEHSRKEWDLNRANSNHRFDTFLQFLINTAWWEKWKPSQIKLLQIKLNLWSCAMRAILAVVVCSTFFIRFLSIDPLRSLASVTIPFRCKHSSCLTGLVILFVFHSDCLNRRNRFGFFVCFFVCLIIGPPVPSAVNIRFVNMKETWFTVTSDWLSVLSQFSRFERESCFCFGTGGESVASFCFGSLALLVGKLSLKGKWQWGTFVHRDLGCLFTHSTICRAETQRGCLEQIASEVPRQTLYFHGHRGN